MAEAQLYQPTALEEAYALYLLDKELGMPPPSPEVSSLSASNSLLAADNNIPIKTTQLRIAGRHAVPFLTRSGLDRILLRTFWTIADPQNVGSLTDKSQFHVLLRLIAMTQAGVIASLATVESSMILLLLHQWASHPLPLPTFDGVIIPEAAFLMTTYWTKSLAVQPLANPGQPLSISDAFGDLPVLDAPLPPLVVAVEEPEVAGISNTPNTTGEPVTSRAASATATTAEASTDLEVVDDDEFGNFESVVEPSNKQDALPLQINDGALPFPSLSTIPTEMMAPDTIPTTFSSSWSGATPHVVERFYSAQESGLDGSSVSQNVVEGEPAATTTTTTEQGDELDDFGDFEDARESSEADVAFGITPSDAVQMTTAAVGGRGVSFLPEPPPPTTVMGSNVPIFGVVGELNHFPFGPAATTSSTLPIDPDDPFSAFDALAPPPVPLPPVIQSSSFDEPPQTIHDGELDDFGDFEAAEPTSEKSAEPMEEQEDLFVDAETTGEQDQTVVHESLDQQLVVEEHPIAASEEEVAGYFDKRDNTDNQVSEASGGSDSEVSGIAGNLLGTTTTDPDDPFSAFDALVPPIIASGSQQQVDYNIRPDTFTDEEQATAAEPVVNGTANVVETFDDDNGERASPERGTASLTPAPFNQQQTENSLAIVKSIDPVVASSDPEPPNATVPVEADGSSDPFSAFERIPPQPLDGSSSVEDPSFPSDAPFQDGESGVPSWSGANSIPSSTLLPSAAMNDDDPFAAFDALVAPIPELPPLPSFGIVPGSVPMVGSEVSEIQTSETGVMEDTAPIVSDLERAKEEEAFEDDDFGDFMFIQNQTSAEATHGDQSELEETPNDSSKEEAASPTVATNEADFHDFGSFSVAETEASTPVASNAHSTGVDLLDAFHSAPNVAPVEIATVNAVSQTHDFEFGDFAAVVTEKDQTEFKDDPNTVTDKKISPDDGIEEDDFGDFEGPVASDPDVEIAVSNGDHAESLVVVEHDDDFGDFGDFEASAAPPEPNADVVSSGQQTSEPTIIAKENSYATIGEEEDNFGDFDSFQHAEGNGVSNETKAFDFDSLADLDGSNEGESSDVANGKSSSENSKSIEERYRTELVPSACNPLPADEPPFSDDNDWGDFHDTPAALEEKQNVADGPIFSDRALEPSNPEAAMHSEESTRKFLALIRTLSPHLPSAIRGPSGATNGVETFISQVEGNVRGLELGEANSEKRMKRCASVMLKISSTHSQLASSAWNQILTVTRDELALGASILEEAIELSPRDLAFMRLDLRTMVAGLGECIRVCRSIVATVGDLLCMKLSTLLTEENLESTWCSIGILELALESERWWKSIQLAVLSLRIGDAVTSLKLESVSDMRTSCLLNSSSSTELCQLTLQPLAADEKSTKSQVSWEGKLYRVGAANLWANRVSTVAP